MSKDLEAIIAEAHQAVEFGTVTLTLKKSQDRVVTVDTTRITRRKVTGNAQALTLIGSMLKLLKEAEDTGNLTFTISLNKGEAEQLMTHDFNRKNLKGDRYV